MRQELKLWTRFTELIISYEVPQLYLVSRNELQNSFTFRNFRREHKILVCNCITNFSNYE